MSRRNLFKKIPYMAGFIGAVILFGGLIGAQAAEEGSKGLVGRLVGHKVSVDSKGKETLVPIAEVVPGDIIEYTLVYQNQEKTNALANIVIASPIPLETVWMMNTPKTDARASLEASIDGGKKYQTPPIWIKTTGPDGHEVDVEAPPEKYTDLRWILADPLPASHEVSVKYRVQVK